MTWNWLRKIAFWGEKNIIRAITNKLENKTQIMGIISVTNMWLLGKKEWQDKINQVAREDVKKWEPSRLL